MQHSPTYRMDDAPSLPPNITCEWLNEQYSLGHKLYLINVLDEQRQRSQIPVVYVPRIRETLASFINMYDYPLFISTIHNRQNMSNIEMRNMARIIRPYYHCPCNALNTFIVRPITMQEGRRLLRQHFQEHPYPNLYPPQAEDSLELYVIPRHPPLASRQLSSVGGRRRKKRTRRTRHRHRRRSTKSRK